MGVGRISQVKHHSLDSLKKEPERNNKENKNGDQMKIYDSISPNTRRFHKPSHIKVGSTRGANNLNHLGSIRDPNCKALRGTIDVRPEDILTLGTLGSGDYSSVTKVYYKPMDMYMAKKVIQIKTMGEEQSEAEAECRILRELNILLKLRCQYIVDFYGVSSSNHTISIYLEYMDIGTLENLYKKIGPIEEAAVSTIALHLLRGLLYLEEEGIQHRDIKPANVLMNIQGETKLSDFGLSKDTHGAVPELPSNTLVGTLIYLSPEQLDPTFDQDNRNKNVQDIWSLGLTLMELAMARFPYETDILYEEEPKSLHEILSNMHEEHSPTLPAHMFSFEFTEFCGRCLTRYPSKRPTAEQLVETDFILSRIQEPFSLKLWLQQYPELFSIGSCDTI